MLTKYRAKYLANTKFRPAVNADVTASEKLLPLGVAEGCVLKRDIKKDEALTYADVEVPSGRLIDQLRKEQTEYFNVLQPA